jgi:lambda family phage tail tape measure protein
MAAKVASLLIDVAADVAKVRKDFGDMSQVVEGFGHTVEKVGDLLKTAIGIFSIEQGIDKIRELVQEVGDLGEKAETMGLGAEQMQAFTVALQQSGVAADQAGALLGKAARTVGTALEGNKEAIDFFKQLNVGLIDAKGNAAEMADVVQRTAAAILKVEDPARRVALASTFMGKSGRDAIPALKELAAGADELRAKYADAIIPDDVIKRFDAFSDALLLAKQKAKAEAAITINDFFSPNLVAAIEQTIDLIGKAMAGLKGSTDAATTAGDQFALMVTRTNDELKGLVDWLTSGTGWVHDMIKAWTEWGMVGDIVLTDLIGKLRGLFGAANAKDFENGVQDKLLALKRFREGMSPQVGETGGTPVLPTTTVTAPRGGFNNFPTAKATGVDKYAEAVKRLNEELAATKAGIDAFNASSNLPTKEAERIAKAAQDVGLEMAKFKDIPIAQRDQLKPLVEQLVQAKFQFDDLKQTQQQADQINTKYSDGTKALADTMYYLNKAYADGKINTDAYTQATKDATDAAALQAEVNKGLGTGLDQMGAGFAHAALQMSQSQTSFKQGEQLFTSSFQIMSSAISEFATTGTINFAKLAQSFAAMLADMAARWIATAAFNALISGASGDPTANASGFAAGGGPQGPSGGAVVAQGAGFLTKLFSGFFADGGPVMGGRAYTVGERGPETFVPGTAGTILPANNNSGDVSVTLNMSGGQQPADAGQAVEFSRKVKAAVLDVVNNEKRPGGTLYVRKSA